MGDEIVASIPGGILVYLGLEIGDGGADIAWMARKAASLRIFDDGKGAMNLSVREVGGEALVVSQFTLLGDARRGNRPSFTDAMPPGEARAACDAFCEALGREGVVVRTGRFQALMDVRYVNRGPVTILLDSRKRF